MRKLRLLLLPFTVIYACVMLVRNWLYDCGLRKSFAFSKPVICVGNITVGGTGKTPLIEYLARVLADLRPSLVSRGYRRKTQGLVTASASSTAEEIGDEPFQIHQKFPQMPMSICADRPLAINALLEKGETDVVLMDDGFQHRAVRAGLNIVVCDYARPMWNDWTFPAGDLREPFVGRRRAQIFVVNKCPSDLSEEERASIVEHLRPTESQTVFFSAIRYGELRKVSTGEVALAPKKALAVAGIGRPKPFFEEVRRRVETVDTLRFADHHSFSDEDLTEIRRKAESLGSEAVIITTEKDATRLPEIEGIEICYLPIELELLFGERDRFNSKIIEYVRKNQ